MKNREIRLKQNPAGVPKDSDFELVETELQAPSEGEVLVRNHYMSVDPYMRGRISKGASYADNWKPGEAMRGGCVGVVVESNAAKLRAGDFVVGEKGWRDYYVTRPEKVRVVDAEAAPVSTHLGVLGMPGMTAYVGLMKLAAAHAGQTVFVSAAAGAVGSLVCQLARDAGCRVIGSAGSPEKVAWLTNRARVDFAMNYRESSNLVADLKTAAPDGIDIYFDNVGTDHLEAALENMAMHGQIVCCGMISSYNATEAPAAPRNLSHIVWKRLRLQGFIVSDHWEHYDTFISEVAPRVRDGRIAYEETVVEALENAPRAFIDLFSGSNLGKMVVKIA